MLTTGVILAAPQITRRGRTAYKSDRGPRIDVVGD
jgi:hypothetical protein